MTKEMIENKDPLDQMIDVADPMPKAPEGKPSVKEQVEISTNEISK